MKNNWTCLLKSAFLSEDKFTFHLKQIDLGIIELGEGYSLGCVKRGEGLVNKSAFGIR